MPQNILIAALGDHPAVVTAMVKGLREIEGIEIETLHLFHPQNTGKYIGREGVRIVRDHLQDSCHVIPEALPFVDASTTADSLHFLQRLAALMSRYNDPGQHRIYLSLAGGRKQIAALMALIPQFFTSVSGLYHLIDRLEADRYPSFPSIDEMEMNMTESEVKAALDPPLENLCLVPIPYPGAFVRSDKLWEFLSSQESSGVGSPVPLTPEAEAFFRTVAGTHKQEPMLQVWLSQTAYEQFQDLAGTQTADNFMKCFRQMSSPVWLKDRIHGTFGDFHFYKRRRTVERPFYRTQPGPIHDYPQQVVKDVIVCGLAIEQGNGQYQPTAERLLETAERQPYIGLSELRHEGCILLVPLGKTPMVASQTYVLLTEVENVKVKQIVVIYPGGNPVIDNGVRLLRKQFRRRDIPVESHPIPTLSDIDSSEACQVYLQALVDLITQLGGDHSEYRIALSLSGGRKGMSALAYFAAQRTGIEQVYHTLITDPELERRIEEETTVEALERLPGDETRGAYLFLEEYPGQHFVLFPIPVLPLQI